MKSPRKPPSSGRSAPRRSPASAGKNPGGRPRSRLPAEISEKIGAPPDSPLLIVRWAARLIAEATWLRLQGRIDRETAAEARAMASGLARLAPLDTIAALEERLRDDRDEVEADRRGPQPEERADGVKPAAIRRNP